MQRLVLLLLALALVACQNTRRDAPAHAAAGAPVLQGTFDNHEQVWRAHEAASAGAPPSHVVVTIDPTMQADWTMWHVKLDATPPLEASWAMHRVVQSGGAITLVPHRSIAAAPSAKFDAAQWTPLDACALRSSNVAFQADTAACVAIAPGIGATAALLPLAIEREGEWLHVRLYADQARGADAREDAREVRWFGGWAAVNGGGPKADADSRDWHMNRDLRLGTEGGRAVLNFRDGSPTGYSLMLERLTYREGNMPVVKLSIVQDADGRTIAYSWANPEASAIGINLGWMQVGLQRDGMAAAPAK